MVILSFIEQMEVFNILFSEEQKKAVRDMAELDFHMMIPDYLTDKDAVTDKTKDYISIIVKGCYGDISTIQIGSTHNECIYVSRQT